MDIPQKTTKIYAHHILMSVVLLGVVGLIVLFFRTQDAPSEECSQNLVFLWEGEYPEPVVHVQEKTEQQGFVDMCLETMKPCQIDVGLYHPWSKNTLRYATHKEKLIYESTVSFQSDLHSYPIGEKVIVEAFLGHDTCILRIGEDRWKDLCPNATKYRLVEGSPNQRGRQFFEASCAQGHKAWIEVNDALFSKPEVSRGVVQGYGQVAAQ